MTDSGVDRHIPLIAHVIYRLQAGGMENGLVNLVNNLPASKFRHAIICVTGKTEFATRVTSGRVAIFELHKRPGLDIGFYLRYWRLVRSLRPDLVHSRNLGTIDLSMLSWLAGVPTRIHSEHGWEFTDASGQNRKYRFLRRICDIFVTAYVAVSRGIASWLVRDIGVDEGKVTQIFNGVDINRFSPAQEQRGADTSAVIIGTVGRLDPIKNFSWLISRFAALLHARPDDFENVVLKLVGDGPERKRLELIAEREGLDGKVVFLGARDDIPNLMRKIDVFVLTSINEGISNTILEAMATGIPVIASRVGGNAELVEHGESGFLYRPDSSDAFDEALTAMVSDAVRRRQFGRAARRRVEERFTLDSMIENYCELYEHHLGS